MSIALMVAALLGGQGIADGNRPEACVYNSRGRVIVTRGLGDISIAPGESVPIAPQWTPFPHHYYPVEHRCLTDWRVSDRRLATLSRNRQTLTIARNAPEGAVVTLTARYRDETIRQVFRVVVPIVSPLVGSWSQRGCDEANRISDILFIRDGRFSVSFVAHYHGGVDYRGRWRVDGNRLILSEVTRERADALPADMALETTFEIDDEGRVTFPTNWWGTSGARGSCRAAFTRSQ